MKGGSRVLSFLQSLGMQATRRSFYQVCEHKAGLDGDLVISKYEPHNRLYEEFFCKKSALRNDNINRLKSVEIK